MTNILFVVRVRARQEADPGYKVRRLRSAPGEIEDWLPDGVHPGNAIIDHPDYRIIRVTGAGMTTALAISLCGRDVLSASDLAKGFDPRHRIWRINYNNFSNGVKNALRNRIPYAQRGTIYDASFTIAQVNAVLSQKGAEARDVMGLPTETNEVPIAAL